MCSSLERLTRELLSLLAAYALGSVPFSYLVARLWGIEDVRKVGSGNVGATNVMRSAGTLPGLLALVLDSGKGAVAVAHRRLDLQGDEGPDRAGLRAALWPRTPLAQSGERPSRPRRIISRAACVA